MKTNVLKNVLVVCCNLIVELEIPREFQFLGGNDYQNNIRIAFVYSLVLKSKTSSDLIAQVI